MRKQFKILIILVVIIGLGIGGYFGYKGLIQRGEQKAQTEVMQNIDQSENYGWINVDKKYKGKNVFEEEMKKAISKVNYFNSKYNAPTLVKFKLESAYKFEKPPSWLPHDCEDYMVVDYIVKNDLSNCEFEGDTRPKEGDIVTTDKVTYKYTSIGKGRALFIKRDGKWLLYKWM